MNTQKAKPSLIAPLGGVIVGIAVFLGVNITIGRAVIPTAESVVTKTFGITPVKRPLEELAIASTGPVDTYHTVCITCHQAEGQGVPGAFPPLAGSEWLLGHPDVPIHIAILGLSGPIEVNGAKFNATMPPPPGLNDEKIAEALTFARTHFGNKASPITPEQVAKVRASLAGRTSSLTTDELRALRDKLPAEGGAAGAEAVPAGAGSGGAAAPTPVAPGAAPAPAPAAAPKMKAPKAAAPTPAAQPAPQPAAQPAGAP
jgi:hypothetical protein